MLRFKRLEFEIVCEDFSNIIGFLIDGFVYKGIFLSGVEIVVVFSFVKFREEWFRNLEN